METLLLVIIILLCCILVLLVGVIGLFLYKIYAQKQKMISTEDQIKNQPDKEIIDNLMQGDFTPLSTQNCVDHPDLPAVGVCCISDDPYCELCLAKENDLKFARKFLGLVLDNEWEDIIVLRNEVIGKKGLQNFYHRKKEIWKETAKPIIAQRQFKINIENDQIEAYTMVKCRPEDKEVVKASLPIEFREGM